MKSGQKSNALSRIYPSHGARKMLVQSLAIFLAVQLVWGNEEDGFCGSIDIRPGHDWSNPVYKEWLNCRIAEGNVKIALMNNEDKPEDYRALPNLTHITGFLLIFQCKSLDSVGRMFPNLRVIGGREKLKDYTLIIYDNPGLKEVGLHNLTEITSGGVRIEENSNLCYADTVNWTRLYGDAHAMTTIQNNKLEKEIVCNQRCAPASDVGCLRNESLPDRPLLCWNEHYCQRDCAHESGCYGPVEALLPCHQHCKGGCTGPGPHECHACRYVHHDGKCLSACPPGYYLFMDRLCLSKEECRGKGGVNHMNKWKKYHPIEWKDPKDNGTKEAKLVCSLDCPPDTREDKLDPTVCINCKEGCPKVCKGGEPIHSIEYADRYKGCNRIVGNLELNMMTEYKSNIGSKFEDVFSDLEEVTGSIEIHFSPSITSLNMFKNLRVLGRDLPRKTTTNANGLTTNSSQNNALIIVENRDLVRLFPDPEKLRIEHGSIRIANNEKLCPRLVDDFIAAVNFSNPKKQKPDEINLQSFGKSNGAKAICEMNELAFTKMEVVMPTMIMVAWEEYNDSDTDHRMFLGYLLYYKEVDDPDSKKVDIYADRDACHDSWMSIYVTNEERGSMMSGLKPYTYYAFYVRTYLINAPGARGAQSDVQVLRTFSAKPSLVREVQVVATDHETISLSWTPPLHERGHVTYYSIRYKMEEDTLDENTNYCHKRGGDSDPDAPKSTEATNISLPKPPVWPPKISQFDSCSAHQCCDCDEGQVAEATPDKARENDAKPVNTEHVQEQAAFEDAIINTIFLQSCKVTPLPEHCKHRSRGRVRRENYSGDLDLISLLNLPDWASFDHQGSSNKNFGKRYDLEVEGDMRKKRELPAAERTFEDYQFAQDYSKFVEDEEQKEYEDWQINNDKGWTLLNVTNTSYTLSGLKHYTSYVFTVSACQDPEDMRWSCSNKTTNIHVRTKPLPANDRINAESILFLNLTDESPRSRIVSWEPPPSPNGPITHYTLEYRSVDSKQSPVLKCIPVADFIANNNSTTLHDIHPGNYSLRIQAVSLLAEHEGGKWSVPRHFVVQSTALLPTHVLVLLAILIPITFVLLCAAMFWFIQHRFKKKLPSYVMTMISHNPDYLSQEIYIKDEWEVNRNDVELLHQIGSGSFGTVYLGEGKNVQSVNGVTFGPCAIKTVAATASPFDRLTFLIEANVMKQFYSPHIVKLYGVVSDGQPALVIMEMMHLGNLRDYLRSRRPGGEENVDDLAPPSCSECLLWAAQIADGMAYLESTKFCHRDLAARNCMVSAERICKIGDFGMARDVYMKDYYKPTGKRLMPVRWMAPESLRDAKFNSKSDVWSYGVVLWEMASLAQQPYAGIENEKVLEYVKDARETLPMPVDCPQVLGDLMKPCWKYEPRQRPTFAEIVLTLLKQLDDSPETHRFLQASFINNGGANASHYRRKESPALSGEQMEDSDSPLNPHMDHISLQDEGNGKDDIELRIVPVCAKNRRPGKGLTSNWTNSKRSPDATPAANGCIAIANGHIRASPPAPPIATV